MVSKRTDDSDCPTGTIGLVMGADTTGVEPQFSMVQYKQLAGGGSLRIINNGLPMLYQG